MNTTSTLLSNDDATISIISGICAAICTTVATVDDITRISWESGYNISQLGGQADFYVLLFGVMYLTWCDFTMDPTATASNFI
jgi:hypothetical protein